MKKRNLLFSIFTTLMIFGVIMVLTNCEGPEGPEGLAGSNGTSGTNGTNGTDGIDGKNADITCGVCHDLSDDLRVRIIQYSNSGHAAMNPSHNSTSCAACMTSQGFIERIANGTTTTAATIVNPAPVNCRTCHNIHTNYDSTDWANTTVSPVTLWLDSTSSSPVDYGKGNLCINCHQPRTISPNPANPTDVDADDSVYISSSYWSYHYGVQGAMLSGMAGYEHSGGTYPNSAHTLSLSASSNQNGCVTCHMQDPYGVLAGGHTFKVEYERSGSMRFHTARCDECHDDTDEMLDTRGEEIDTLLTRLKTDLLAKNMITSSDRVVRGTYHKDHAGAILNYLFVLKDHSGGVHNFKYAQALLTNSIAAIQ